MILYYVVSFLLTCDVIKSDMVDIIECKDSFMDKHCKIVDVNVYCANKQCVTKCCGVSQVLNGHKCINFSHPIIVNYTKLDFYSWGGDELKISKKKLHNFVLVQNERFNNNTHCAYKYPLDTKFFILEDGSLKIKAENRLRSWIEIDKLNFCVEIQLVLNGTNINTEFIIIEKYEMTEAVMKSKFTVIGMIVSCVFMLLVLLVYGCLRQLRRTLAGLMLMAYVSSLFVTYLINIVMVLDVQVLISSDCKKIGPIAYFAMLSSFFWLNIMSYDVWCSLRAFRKRHDIYVQQSVMVKFLRYCRYGWGIPLLITIAVTVFDNIDHSNWPYTIDPPFKTCFAEDDSVYIYVYIPIGIIMVVDIAFFLMTAYNVWLIKRIMRVYNSADSRRSQKDTYRFGMYIKMAVLMGLSWCLELVPDVSLWWYILINLSNLLVGVIIFFLFVFNKKVLLMLCERMAIRSKYIENLRHSYVGSYFGSRSGTVRTADTFKSSQRSQMQESTF